jgi:hypothetical protein
MQLWQRMRSAYRFWSTDDRFKWGARNQFVVMAPVMAVVAIICAAVGAWAAAIFCGIAALYMGNWLLKNRGSRKG